MRSVLFLLVIGVLAALGWYYFDKMGSDAKDTKPGEQIEKDTIVGMYKWVDNKGVVHFTNEEKNIPEEYRAKAEKDVQAPNLTIIDDETAKKIMDGAAAEGGADSEAKPKSKDLVRRSGKVALYGTSTCPKTEKVRVLLKRMGVGFADVNVEKDARHMQALLDFTGGHSVVPVTVIDGVPIIGYRPEDIQRAIQAMKLLP